MKGNLRMAAVQRAIWKAGELQRLLAERGLVISAGKMSGLWSGHPASVKLDELEVIRATLGCEVGELLIREPESVPQPVQHPQDQAATADGCPAADLAVTPQPRPGRSLPPR
ncbi:helix-turn-helix transcriptional regulator [Nonomuraea sp. NPDC000554]|uniref:helix-turn-helix domain-containing protein n=1 Tax=Nonomuraea sp. NPDC000554 TaxID=3154259 RepID=UPI00331C9B1A